MPFPWLRRFGSSGSGRGGRRRRQRAQQRVHGEEEIPGEAPAALIERRHQRLGFSIGATLLLVIIGVVVYGYYQEFYRPPRVWAGSVNNVEFNMGDLVRRIRVLQGVNRYQGGRVDLGTAPFEDLQNLINAEILRQRTESLGFQITDDDIEEELRRQFVPTADPGQETDPGQLEREFKDNYGAYLTATGLSDGDYRVIVEEQLNERGLRSVLFRDIELVQPQVEIQWIQLLFDSEILPIDVARRLENEDFTRVAQELNSITQFAGVDGYVGWVPRGAFPNLDETIFGDRVKGAPAQAPGSVSNAIYTNDGSFLVKVISGPEEREVTTSMLLKLIEEGLKLWQKDALTSGTKQQTVRMNFNSRYYDWVTDQVLITAPRLDAPEPAGDPLLPGFPDSPRLNQVQPGSGR